MGTQHQDYIPLLAAMTDTERAYLAGLIDGEGSIYIAYAPAAYKNGFKRRADSHLLVLKVAMTDEPTIDWIVQKTGCRKKRMTFGQRNRLGHIRTPAYSALCSALHSVRVLERILPFLICKRAEAELGIEFHYKTRWEQTFGTGIHKGRQPLPKEIIDLRHDYYLRLRDLKPRSRRTRENRQLRAQGLIGPPES